MIVFQFIALPVVLLFLVRSLYRLIRGDRPRWGPVVGTVVWLTAAAAIVRPQLTNVAAGWLGIGRGADLLIYILAISFVVLFLYMHRKHRRLESEITQIVRSLALNSRTQDETSSKERSEPPGSG